MRGAGSITFIVGGLLVLAAWSVGAAGLPSVYRPFSEVLAEPLALLLVVLAWRFRRGRLAVAAVIIALANVMVRGPLDIAGNGSHRAGVAAMALLLAVNLGVLALTKDHPLPRLRSLLHLAAVVVQPLLVAAILYAADRAPWIANAAEPLRLLAAPQVALLVFLIAAVFAGLAFAARRTTFEIGVVWCLAAAAVALLADLDVHRATLMFAAAQLALLFALVEDSYRLAYQDQLTGLAGRRALDEELRALEGEYAIAMIDIDHFKRFNDRHGHDAGDQALRMVADELGKVGGGRAYRYGGEEFAILFPGRSAAASAEALERLRAAIESRTFAIRSAKRPRRKPDRPVPPANPPERVTLTVSVGAAGSGGVQPDPASVLRAADQALYRAKRRGRNRVVVDGARSTRKRR